MRKWEEMTSYCYNIGLFPDSSAVEQQTVNLLVRGSIPRRGARYSKPLELSRGFFTDEPNITASKVLGEGFNRQIDYLTLKTKLGELDVGAVRVNVGFLPSILCELANDA